MVRIQYYLTSLKALAVYMRMPNYSDLCFNDVHKCYNEGKSYLKSARNPYYVLWNYISEDSNNSFRNLEQL